MAYRPIVIPAAATVETRALVVRQIDPAMADVHAMLRLPLPEIGLDAECALSPTLVLLAIVDGVAHRFCSPGSQRITFVRALIQHFPWDQEPRTGEEMIGAEAAETLWCGYRDALAHNLGGYRDRQQQQLGSVKLLKGAISEAEIESIERATRRPQWHVPMLRKVDEGASPALKLTVKCLYWGVRQMIESVLRDEAKLPVATTGGLQLETSATASLSVSPPIMISRAST
jgi:hypothetical protein